MVDYSRLMHICQLFNNHKFDILFLPGRRHKARIRIIEGCGLIGYSVIVILRFPVAVIQNPQSFEQ